MSQKPARSTTARDPNRPATRPGRVDQRHLLFGFGLVCLLAIALFITRSSSRSTFSSVDRADPTSGQLVARGEQLYATRCASCHGSDRAGEPGWPQRRANGTMPASPLNERGQAWQQDDQWFFTTIKDGGQATAPAGYPSAMPAFGGGLEDGEIWAIISYLKSTWPPQTQSAQPQTGE